MVFVKHYYFKSLNNTVCFSAFFFDSVLFNNEMFFLTMQFIISGYWIYIIDHLICP